MEVAVGEAMVVVAEVKTAGQMATLAETMIMQEVVGAVAEVAVHHLEAEEGKVVVDQAAEAAQ